MIDLKETYNLISESSLQAHLEHFSSKVNQAMRSTRWGDLSSWLEVLGELPEIKPSSVRLNVDQVTIGERKDCDEYTRRKLEQLLRKLHPWRKGPFKIFGTEIDTEWRSDLKWNRIKNIIQPLRDRLVLDVGCGSGYHCWRIAGEGSKFVMGIDPTILYAIQFHAMQKYIHRPDVTVLPIGIDDMPMEIHEFDTVFSMGLLYHRRSPFDHLLQLKSFLKEGGELVLETLVIDGKQGDVLSPATRYAKMPNVWFIPSVKTLESWLKRMQFTNIQLIDVTQTTSEEQRVTDWMGFESLSDFLDPENPNLTLEGYPAPKRAIFLANS